MNDAGIRLTTSVDSTEAGTDESDTHKAVSAANVLAGALVKQRKFSGAKIALCRALTAIPNSPELWSNLSAVMWNLRAYEDALACARNSLQCSEVLHPSKHVTGLMAAANALTSLGEYDKALVAYNEAIASEGIKEQELLDARWNRTLLLLLLGNYKEGFEFYGIRIDRDKAEFEKDKDLFKSPLWSGESLTGKSILILHDQGYGDTIMYSRFLSQMTDMARKVYLSIVPDLIPLLWRYTDLGVEFIHNGTQPPQTDYHTYIGSIPSMVGVTSPQDLPAPDPQGLIKEQILEGQKSSSAVFVDEPRITPSLKVGICWSGRKDFIRNDERQIPLRFLASLAENPQMWLYSLQVGPQAQEIQDLGLEHFIMDLSPQISSKGWIGTATAILQLDVVVTCCTSIAHLAGVLGVPCFVMLHTEPYWVWGYKGVGSEWYPNTRLFRQVRNQRGNWLPVLQEVSQALSEILLEKAAVTTGAK